MVESGRCRIVAGCLIATMTISLAGAADARRAAGVSILSSVAPGTMDTGRLRLPRLVRKVKPQFPKQAVRAGVNQAVVYVQFIIDTRGRTSEWKVLESRPPELGFEGEAVKAVRKYRYEPALKDGDPVAVWWTAQVDFVYPDHEP